MSKIIQYWWIGGILIIELLTCQALACERDAFGEIIDISKEKSEEIIQSPNEETTNLIESLREYNKNLKILEEKVKSLENTAVEQTKKTEEQSLTLTALDKKSGPLAGWKLKGQILGGFTYSEANEEITPSLNRAQFGAAKEFKLGEKDAWAIILFETTYNQPAGRYDIFLKQGEFGTWLFKNGDTKLGVKGGVIGNPVVGWLERGYRWMGDPGKSFPDRIMGEKSYLFGGGIDLIHHYGKISASLGQGFYDRSAKSFSIIGEGFPLIRCQNATLKGLVFGAGTTREWGETGDANLFFGYGGIRQKPYEFYLMGLSAENTGKQLGGLYPGLKTMSQVNTFGWEAFGVVRPWQFNPKDNSWLDKMGFMGKFRNVSGDFGYKSFTFGPVYEISPNVKVGATMERIRFSAETGVLKDHSGEDTRFGVHFGISF